MKNAIVMTKIGGVGVDLGEEQRKKPQEIKQIKAKSKAENRKGLGMSWETGSGPERREQEGTGREGGERSKKSSDQRNS